MKLIGIVHSFYRKEKRAATGSYAIDFALSVTSFREAPNGMS